MELRLLLLTLFTLISPGTILNISAETTLEVVHQWKFVDYEYDSQERKDKVLKDGNYSKNDIIIMDFHLVQDGRTFIILRKSDESPVTLGTVSDIKTPNGPLIKPYPSWPWHLRKDCFGIYRATKVQTDTCNSNRLWVLDNGQKSAAMQNCQPQILLFELSSNRLIARYPIPMKFARASDGKGQLYNFIVQTSGWFCRKTTIYMSYFQSNGMLVWNGCKFWRVNGPDPELLPGTLAIKNRRIKGFFGFYGFALSPQMANKPQYLAMSSVGSVNVFTATTADILASEPKHNFFYKWLIRPILNLFRRAKPQENDVSIKYKVHEKRLPNPGSSFAFDSKGILFTGINTDFSLACANTTIGPDFPKFEVIDKDVEKLNFVSGANVYDWPITGGTDEELWILTNRFVDFLYNKLDLTKYNYRIMKRSVKELTAGHNCAA